VLAQAGLPTTGAIVGYEIFDKEDSISATNFSQNIKLIRALEGELGRTISAFEAVERARVHLVMPQREIFSREKLDPKASVVLKFRGGKRLNRNEIDAIGHLIVTAVAGLEMKNITIVDTKGRALKIGSEDGGDFSSSYEEVKVAEEARLKQVIESLLENSFGSGKVKASVALEMNFDKVVMNSETYDPEGAVARSVQSVDEKEQTPVGGSDSGDVSAASNLPGGSSSGGSDQSKFATVEKSEQTTNYEISKTIKNQITESGIIKKMSIAILVDGIYNVNKETQEVKYTPRSQEEIDKITNLVKMAVGFDPDRSDRLEVINMAFANEGIVVEDDSLDWFKEELPNLFQTLIFAIVVVLVLVTVIRPIAMKAFEVRGSKDLFGGAVDGQIKDNALQQAGAVAEGAAGAPGVAATGIPTVLGEIRPEDEEAIAKQMATSVRKVNHLVEVNPQDLVNVLRKWLNEEN
jgi:flagellar M-ring protein FliF